MSSSTQKLIEDRVEAFVQDLTGLIRQAALEAIHESLGETGGTRRGKKRASKKTTAHRSTSVRRSSGTRKKRSGKQVEGVAIRVLGHVKKNPGLRVTEIGKALRLAPKDMRLPILKLVGDKKIKTKGQRRGTKYFPK